MRDAVNPTVGLAIIAKNEQDRIGNLLASIDGAFDQVVLVDTGSTDYTKHVFNQWATAQNAKGVRTNVYDFEWIKDFAAARTFAHSKLDTDWEVWADCDDVIAGAQNLRAVAAQAPENVAGYIAGYNYAQHPQTGQCVCYLKRERLVRRGRAKWVNRVHEAQVVDGMVAEVAPAVVEWHHRKQMTEQVEQVDTRRNLDILEEWVKDEPDNTRVLAYLGTETMARGDTEGAIAHFHNYLAHNPDWDEERAQVHRKLAVCYMANQRFDEAIQCAFNALRVLPSWTDSYLTLAEAHYVKGELPKAVEWARETLRRGTPNTLLIVNPLDYSYAPMKVLSGALGSLGQVDEAIKVGTEAWQLNPGDQELAQAIQVWREQSKREHTANSVALMAQQLMAHDEQLKAQTLLEECVPHFVEHHPGIVQLRSALRERLRWVPNPRSLLDHYATGGSKPEDFLPEDKCDEVAAALPRVQFLYRGIHDQLIQRHHAGLMDAAHDQVEAAVAAVGLNPGDISDWDDASRDDRRIT